MLGPNSPNLVVLLASVLKPVDDTRMLGKFAHTLSGRPGVQVHVAGRAADTSATAAILLGPRIGQHALFSGSRLSLGRLAAQWRYWRLLQRLRPALVVVHAPELLPLTLLWHRLGPQRQFLYDIRENYALNVTTQQVYQGITRRWLAAGLRWIEHLAAGRASGLLLAEASYASELPFLHEQLSNRVLVLENKYQPTEGEVLDDPSSPVPPPAEPLRLLYSGTISELNGVWEAIDLARGLHAAWPGGAHLTIIGFCQQPELLVQLQAVVARHPVWLTLVGGGQPVPHARIVAEICRSHLGLLPYRPHPSTERCRPTKLFEYLAHGLPVVATPNSLWLELLNLHGAGFALDFASPGAGTTLAAQVQHTVFYPHGVPTDVQWESEGKKLWLLLDSLI